MITTSEALTMGFQPLSNDEAGSILKLARAAARYNGSAPELLKQLGTYYALPDGVALTSLTVYENSAFARPVPTFSSGSGYLDAEEMAFDQRLTADHPFLKYVHSNIYQVRADPRFINYEQISRAERKKTLHTNPEALRLCFLEFTVYHAFGKEFPAVIDAHRTGPVLYRPVEMAADEVDLL